VPISLLPTPDGRRPELRDELRRVKNASPARTLESLGRIFGPRSWLTEFRADPAAMLARLAATIGRCHDALIAPHWPRMRALLEADIEFRARRMAAAGVERVVAELHRDVRWLDEGGVLLHLDKPHRATSVVATTVAGLVLCPTIFSWPHATTSLRPSGPACMRYPARGIATLWELPAHRPSAALRELLGATRAGILLALAEPSDTPTLARRLGVTHGAVSQHLRVLRNAGLVATQRDGRTAVHARTARAAALLG
jgi:predicted transcriptional regulator